MWHEAGGRQIVMQMIQTPFCVLSADTMGQVFIETPKAFRKYFWEKQVWFFDFSFK